MLFVIFCLIDFFLFVCIDFPTLYVIVITDTTLAEIIHCDDLGTAILKFSM